MKRQAIYAPAGRCIYCGGDGSPGQLTNEHIIAESLGGMLILPSASCRECQDITGAIEGHNAHRLFRPIRRQFSLPSKSRGKVRKEARANEKFLVVVDGRKVWLPLNEFPGLLVSFAFPMPTIVVGARPTLISFSGGVAIGTLPEFGERLNAVRAKYGNNVTFPASASAESVGRLLAKIAHAYAAAEVGIGNFTPFLLGIIRNHDPLMMHHFIGSAVGVTPVSGDLHEIGISPPETLGTGKLIVVKIHLFSNLQGMPCHYVVAGERR